MEVKTNLWKQFWSTAGKVLNISWKVALVVIGLFAAFLIAYAVWEETRENHGDNAHYWDSNLSENICVHMYRRGTVQVYDRKVEKYVTPKLKWVAGVPERDSLTVFCDKNDRRGFINVNTGEIVIEGRYEHAWVFSEGLAAVVEPGGKMGFIDKTGEYVIAPELEYIPTHDYLFKHNVCCIENSDRKQGLLDRNGVWVLPQEYNFINYANAPDMFIPRKDGKAGVVRNGSFEWVYPMEYDNIYWTDAPSGEGFILYRDFCLKHVAVDGTVLNSFLVDETSELKYMTKYHSGEPDEYDISDKVIAFRVHGLWGVMDRHTGKVLVPAKYGSVEMASGSIIKCSIKEYGEDDCVLYDLKGNKISNY